MSNQLTNEVKINVDTSNESMKNRISGHVKSKLIVTKYKWKRIERNTKLTQNITKAPDINKNIRKGIISKLHTRVKHNNLFLFSLKNKVAM